MRVFTILVACLFAAYFLFQILKSDFGIRRQLILLALFLVAMPALPLQPRWRVCTPIEYCKCKNNSDHLLIKNLMDMRHLFAFLVMLLFCVASSAQQLVFGSVRDGFLKVPLVNARVTLLTADSVVVQDSIKVVLNKRD